MAFSVRATQLAQVMPVMGSSMVVSRSLIVLRSICSRRAALRPAALSVPALKRWYPQGYTAATARTAGRADGGRPEARPPSAPV